jgi:hypothetical protein
VYERAPTTLPRAKGTVVQVVVECGVVAVVVENVGDTERTFLQTSTIVETSIDQTGTAFGKRH